MDPPGIGKVLIAEREYAKKQGQKIDPMQHDKAIEQAAKQVAKAAAKVANSCGKRGLELIDEATKAILEAIGITLALLAIVVVVILLLPEEAVGILVGALIAA